MNVLEEIRRKIGPQPRRIPAEFRQQLITRPPLWVPVMNDDLAEFYRNQELLLREGTVGWGAIVQANGMLYGPGPCDAPATVIYSTEAALESDPDRLADIASNLCALRGGAWPDADEQSYGDMLQRETVRAMGIDIPRAFNQGLQVRSTTAMIRRPHLPGRILKGRTFPILTHAKTKAVMIVPSPAWPESLAEGWRVHRGDYPDSAWTENFMGLMPDAAEYANNVAVKFNFGNEWYLRVYADEPTDGFDIVAWRLNFVFQMKASRHLLSESYGVKLIVSRAQADLFAGLQIGLKQAQTAVFVKGPNG